jgi:hypothetical protein
LTSLHATHAALRFALHTTRRARPDALVLIAMLVALRLAVFYVLRVKTRTRLA